jgi:hypothetical protein
LEPLSTRIAEALQISSYDDFKKIEKHRIMNVCRLLQLSSDQEIKLLDLNSFTKPETYRDKQSPFRYPDCNTGYTSTSMVVGGVDSTPQYLSGGYEKKSELSSRSDHMFRSRDHRGNGQDLEATPPIKTPTTPRARSDGHSLVSNGRPRDFLAVS